MQKLIKKVEELKILKEISLLRKTKWDCVNNFHLQKDYRKSYFLEDCKVIISGHGNESVKYYLGRK